MGRHVRPPAWLTHKRPGAQSRASAQAIPSSLTRSPPRQSQSGTSPGKIKQTRPGAQPRFPSARGSHAIEQARCDVGADPQGTPVKQRAPAPAVTILFAELHTHLRRRHSAGEPKTLGPRFAIAVSGTHFPRPAQTALRTDAGSYIFCAPDETRIASAAGCSSGRLTALDRPTRSGVARSGVARTGIQAPRRRYVRRHRARA